MSSARFLYTDPRTVNEWIRHYGPPYRILFTTVPGIEDIVIQELLERFPTINPRPKPFGGLGRVLAEFSSPPDVEDLLKLRSIHHILLHLTIFPVDEHLDSLVAIYDALYQLDLRLLFHDLPPFRITSERAGTHSYTSIDVQRWAGQAIVDRYAAPVDLRNPLVNIEVDVLEKRCFVGVRLTKTSLHRRGYRVFEHPAALRPTLAYAMVRIADPLPGSTLLDPMCGGGTIPIEAALVYRNRLRILGFDLSPDFIVGAIQNARKANVAQYIDFRVVDVRRLPQSLQQPIHRVVTNPPYGIRSGGWKRVPRLYAALTRSLSRVLSSDGRAVIITLRHNVLRQCAYNAGLRVVHERVVRHGDLFPKILVLQPE